MITPASATWIARIIEGYLLTGAAFALPYVVRWAGRMDPVAAHGTWGFRVLIFPGAALLWPVLLLRVLRHGSRP